MPGSGLGCAGAEGLHAAGQSAGAGVRHRVPAVAPLMRLSVLLAAEWVLRARGGASIYVHVCGRARVHLCALVKG